MNSLSGSFNGATHFSLSPFTFGPSAIDCINTPVYEFEDSAFGSVQSTSTASKFLPQSGGYFSEGGLQFGPLGEHPAQDDLPLQECFHESHPFYVAESQQESQCIQTPWEFNLSSLERIIDPLPDINDSQTSCGRNDYMKGCIPEEQQVSYDPERFIQGLGPSNHPLLEDIKHACSGKVKHIMAPPLKMTGCSDLDLFMLHQFQTAIDAYRTHMHVFESIDCLGDHIMADFQATCKQIQDPGRSMLSSQCAHQNSTLKGGTGQTDKKPARFGDSERERLSRNCDTPDSGDADSNPLRIDEGRNCSCSQDTSASNTDTSSSHTLSSGSPLAAAKKKSSKLPQEATLVLKKWLFDHSAKPYPDDDEKQHLCLLTGLSLTQVCNWFINARRRILRRKKK